MSAASADMTIASEIRVEIERRLVDIEQQSGVEIFYACESGSRAWNFASADSDYDVRFLYRHPRDWYLSLAEGRDVIEAPIEGVYDVNGWDLRKALRLAMKGNPVLFEWLSSPIRYVERPLFARFRDAAFSVFDPKAAYRHYQSMAFKHWRTHFTGDQVRRKKYFYVVRPLLACLHLLYRGQIVPMRFEELVDAVSIPAGVRRSLDGLLQEKRQSGEAMEGPRLQVLDSWIERTLDALRYREPSARPAGQGVDMDAFLRSALKD